MNKTDIPFDAQRTGTGTNEWAETTFNICRGCAHNCRYCYAATNANRFGLRTRDAWAREELTNNADIKRYPAKGGVIMFPSTHDITPYTVDAYIRVALLMLKAGNRLLIVSKPHLDCVDKMCESFGAFRDKILFRFTITSTYRDVAAFWEPFAPVPAERIAALDLAWERGFRTSVSSEPLLGGLETAMSILNAVRPSVTDTLWIGKMNKIRTRVDMRDPVAVSMVREIENAQTDTNIMRMVKVLSEDPIVRWKDSINEVIMKSGDVRREYPKVKA